MGILNFTKDSIMAGFFSKKAFDNLRKKAKFEDALKLFLIGAIFSLLLISGLGYFGLLTKEGFSIEGIYGILYALFLIFTQVVFTIGFVYVTQILFNNILNLKKKTTFKQMFTIYIISMTAIIIPGILLFILLIVILVLLSILNQTLGVIIFLFGLIGYFVFVFYLIGKIYAEILKTDTLKTVLIYFLSGILISVIITIALIAIIGLIGYSLITLN